MKEVAIIQRRLTGYREPLFEKLRDRLLTDRVYLRLLHGIGTDTERKKNDGGNLPWAELLSTRYILGDRLCWQPFFGATQDSNLVIITQENWMLANHLALFRSRQNKLAFWGHGGNFQRQELDWRDRFKDWTSRQVDWWFAYTRLSEERIAEAGVPQTRITCLNNSIDTQELTSDLDHAKKIPRQDILQKYCLDNGQFGIFIGALYKAKRLDFLIESAIIIRRVIPDFQLLVLGSGPEEMRIRTASSGLDWIHFLGSRRGGEKAELLEISDILLNPGLVGLGIFDAFCAGLPIVTTDCGLHSPEIVYLTSDVGLMSGDNVNDFATAAIKTLSGRALRDSAARLGPRLAENFGLDQMVENFTNGILRALES